MDEFNIFLRTCNKHRLVINILHQPLTTFIFFFSSDLPSPSDQARLLLNRITCFLLVILLHFLLVLLQSVPSWNNRMQI